MRSRQHSWPVQRPWGRKMPDVCEEQLGGQRAGGEGARQGWAQRVRRSLPGPWKDLGSCFEKEATGGLGAGVLGSGLRY